MLNVKRLIVLHTLTESLYLFCAWSSESLLKCCKCASNDPARDTMCCSGESKKMFFTQVSKWWNLDFRGRLSGNAWEITHCIDILSEPSTAEDTEIKQINPFSKEQADVNTVHNVCKVNSMLSTGRSVYNCCVQNQSLLLIPMCWHLILSHQNENNKLHQAFFKGRPVFFRVNSREEESDVSVEANIKTHAGEALKITWALGGEESRSHTAFSITLPFLNNPCFSSCHSCFLYLSLYSPMPKLEESLNITF